MVLINSTAITDFTPNPVDIAALGSDEVIFTMDKLYPALLQCFAIIICGYMAGRLNIISNAESKGLNTFVGTFALPSLIFLSLAELEWHTVNWNFLLSILISKAVVFFAVATVSLLVVRPLNLGRAGVLAIFCTQSNDFAIGYPIVMALYEKIHPEYAAYLYLVAPISLAILNPIGLVMMEISNMRARRRESVEEQPIRPIGCPRVEEVTGNRFLRGRILTVAKFIESVFFNPILLMTVLGVIGGVAFPNGIPELLMGVLKVLGNSFSATALFLLGLRMVGKAHKLQGPGFLIPGILILVKLLVLPIVIRQTVNIMNAGANFTDTTDLGTFGFLYGTIPAAPGVFVIASQYNTEVDLVASSMVACTFISAPLMVISAKMITLTNLNPAKYLSELVLVAFDISVSAIIACFWLLLLFSVTRKIRRMPHKITSCLVLSQLISSVGVLLWSIWETCPDWLMYLQFSLFTIGTYSSRLWCACLAITLLFLQCRSLCFVLKLWPWFVGIAWGIPTLIVSFLLIFDSSHITLTERKNPSFQYGNAQAAIAVFLLVMCFIVTVGCLVLHQRYKKRFEKYLTLSKEISTPDQQNDGDLSTSSTSNLIQSETDLTASQDVEQDNEVSGSNCHSSDGCCSQSTTTVLDIEDLVTRRLSEQQNGLCSAQFNCAGTSRQSCQTLIQRYQEETRRGLEPLEFDENVDDHQTLKHTVLLILLLCSMFVGLALSIWTLVLEGMSGIYVELSFLDAFLNFGQSLIVLACFITDTGDLLLPFVKYWRKIWYGANVVQLPTWSNLSAETKNVCDQFTTHHLENCRKTIAQDKRWRIRTYRRVFFGNIFVDWLVKVGLARDRVEATKYARHLVDGRVLRHINNVYHFHDKNLLYTFCDRL
ncbi:integral membrane protein GPR155 [Phlebotomus argentipes]|uniref:integral membrane protein GPR155 n=1 Tax=Phlebotomus argentipes TaxID=94469 RepID=UPI0028936450|nr:integral membrane protein GPR155 [Phlebotomus argentipes]XP_059615440.1 integral membrane protein GPR155 [Phlebotomus argentipes]